jgi:AraC-like DNA-binding protein
VTARWITAIGVTHLLRGVALAGADPRPLRERFGLPERPTYDQRISVSTLVDAWEAALELTGSRALPVLAATRAAHDEESWLGYVVANQRRFGDGVALADRYYPTVSNVYGWRLVLEDDLVHYVCSPPGPIDRLGWQAYLEFEAADLAVIGRRITADAASPIATTFLHPAPDAATIAELAGALGVTPRFSQPVCELVYPRSILELEVPGARPGASALVERKLAELLDAERRGAAVTTRVRAALPDLMRSGRAGVPELARALHMSRRSLERALAEEGTSATALLDDERKQLALAW